MQALNTGYAGLPTGSHKASSKRPTRLQPTTGAYERGLINRPV